MKNFYKLLALVILLLPLNAYSDGYLLFGGGLDGVKHDKSSSTFPMLNIELGIGYKYRENINFELDITGTSGSELKKNGTCTIESSQFSCEKNEKIIREMLFLSTMYTKHLSSSKLFIKAGAGVIKSRYKSTFNQTELTKEDSLDPAISLNIGMIMNTHRFGMVLSNKYGSSNTGSFSFIGVEYNYLLDISIL